MTAIITILEARVPADRHADLRAAYRAAAGYGFPPGLVKSVLLRDAREPDVWRIETRWDSRESLQAMRQGGTPRGVLMFRAAGAEPTLTIFEVTDELRPGVEEGAGSTPAFARGEGRKPSQTLDGLLAAARARAGRLSPAEAHAAMGMGACLVDIRPEFQRHRDGEIPGAIVIERNHVEWRLHPGSPARIPEAVGLDVPWIILCDEGYASSLAAATLVELGLRASDVAGGFRAWRDAGLPVGPPGQVSQPRLPPTE